MSIARDSIHKRRATGGKRKAYRKKRQHELGRQPAMTRLGPKRIHLVRCRFGIIKRRALRLETGNFAWPTQAVAMRARILNVVYNASNNELVRTNTLVRSAVVQVDAAPFRQWFLKHYGLEVGKKAKKDAAPAEAAKKEAEKKVAKTALARFARRQKLYKMDPALEEEFGSGRLLARITSRPGQVGRADGYILEGKELEFYQKKLEKRKKTK